MATDEVALQVMAGLTAVREAIAGAARAVDRDPQSVTLVAVSKLQGLDRIEAAIAAGQTVFGENRVQEAERKLTELKARTPGLVLHLIGALQTNKAGDAIRLFDVIECVDRPKLARSLAREMDRAGRRPACFIQVNTGEEPQKAGVWPEELDALVGLCRDELELPVEGLMCIPPIDEAPALHFALLRDMAARNGLAKLSMGMSADFEQAIRLGATHVRVGTAIFGARPPREAAGA